MGPDRPLILATPEGSRSPLELLRDETPGSRSPGSFAVSFGVHAGILLALVLLAQRVVPVPPKPTIRLVVDPRELGGGGAPPPRLGAPRDRPAPQVKPVVPVEPRPRPTIVAPTTLEPPQDAALLEAGDPAGAEGGAEHGIVGSWGDGSLDEGIGGPGDGRGPGQGDGPVPGIAEPLRVTKAVIVHRVEPRYPRVHIVTGREGTVVLDAVIDEEGNVVDVRALTGDPAFAAAGMAAVREWRFQPAMVDGRPRRIVLTVSIDFRLRR